MKAFVPLALFALLSGCSGIVIGNAVVIGATPESVAQHVVIGHTRKSEVEAAYGTPTSKTYDSAGIETWFYGSTAANLNGDATSHKSLQVQFDKAGVASYYLLTDADPQQARRKSLGQ